MTQPITYNKLTKAQIEAIRATLQKYGVDPEDGDISDSLIESWANFATSDTLHSRLETLNRWYKSNGDKSTYLKGMEILKQFHPEIDSPLFNVMREMTED